MLLKLSLKIIKKSNKNIKILIKDRSLLHFNIKTHFKRYLISYYIYFKKFFINIYKKNFNLNIYINSIKYNYSFIYFIYQYKNGLNKSKKLSILEFCITLGLFIPHFCYHPDLSIAGNCRMCLVQLSNSTKPVAACAIKASPNLIIKTQTQFIKKIQEVF